MNENENEIQVDDFSLNCAEVLITKYRMNSVRISKRASEIAHICTAVHSTHHHVLITE